MRLCKSFVSSPGSSLFYNQATHITVHHVKAAATIISKGYAEISLPFSSRYVVDAKPEHLSTLHKLLEERRKIVVDGDAGGLMFFLRTALVEP